MKQETKDSKCSFKVGIALAALAGALAVLPARASQPQQANTVYANDGMNGETVTLNPGDTLIVSLLSNVSTGYAWSVAQNNPQLLQPQGSPVYQPSTSGLLGAQGSQVFTFQAVGSGGEGLRLLYQNPSLRGVQAANQYFLMVVINRGPPPQPPPDPPNPPSPRTIYLSEFNNNGTTPAELGDTIILTLPANPSTGYSWSIAQNDPAILQPAGQSTTRGVRPGQGGFQVFTFQVVGNGGESLRLLYQRPFASGGIQAANTFQVFIDAPQPGQQPVG